MSFGNILGQLFQDGLGQSQHSRNRIETAGQNLDAGGGIEGIFDQIQDALTQSDNGTGGDAGADAGGGLADRARTFLREEQVAGLSGRQAVGIGAAAGALLGGGLKGAARGGALAVLGTLALGALKKSQAQQDADAAGPSPDEVRAVTGPGTEQLILRAMINAAKADGKIDGAEIGKIIGRLSADEATEAEKRFVTEEMDKPIDIAGLAAQVRSPAQAAEVYAATLFTIHVDTPEEQAYLRTLAPALGLDAGTVAELHRLTGAPV